MEEQLFDAIKYIVDSQIEKTENQKFIKCQVIGGKQLDGSYMVEHQGLNLKAFPGSSLSKYTTGEFVYVLLPTGNISDKRIIFSSTKMSADETDVGDLTQDFEEIKDSIVIVGENYITNGKDPVVLNSSNREYTLLFKDKFGKHHNQGMSDIRISADISSNLNSASLPSSFDYGIYIKISYSDNSFREMKFSYKQMFGYVYNLNNVLQQKIYEISAGKTVVSVEGKVYTTDIPLGGSVTFANIAVEFISDVLNDLINSQNYSIEIISDKGVVFKEEESLDVTLTCQIMGNNMFLDPYARLFKYEWYEITYVEGEKHRELISASTDKINYNPLEPNKLKLNTASVEDINFFECDVYTI